MASETRASEEAGASVPIPRDNIIRAVLPGVELRAAAEDGGPRKLVGHFARFNEWTEINSMWEGRFMERIAPGAFAKTFRDNRDNIKVLFDHGHDPSIGNKPLGPIRALEEDEEGARYEVDMLDTSYNRDLIPALEAGLLGASFRFRVVREDVEDNPKRVSNEQGLPERTIKEVSVAEFGPVTFPAYSGATAGVRSVSLTDEIIMRRFLQQPDSLRSLLLHFLPAENEEGSGEAATPTQRAEPEAHPSAVRRAANAPLFGLDRKEPPAWQL